MSSILNKISDKLSSNQKVEEVPVVKERIHDHYDEVDKTQQHEVRDKTHVETVIQPITDEQRNAQTVERRDEGEVIREHGQAGLDANAEAQLRARREEVARQGGTEYSETRRDISERPNVDVVERQHNIEQVQPVMERDVYNPHRVEHHRKEIDIVHEAPTVGGTRVAPAVTVDEYQQGHGARGSATSSSSSD